MRWGGFFIQLLYQHHGIFSAGVIDRDYRGNVGVVLFNMSKTDYSIKIGDRIAQLVLEKILTPSVRTVEVIILTIHTHLLIQWNLQERTNSTVSRKDSSYCPEIITFPKHHFHNF